MLRDLPPFRSPQVESFMDLTDQDVILHQNYEDPLDDVFGSGPASPNIDHAAAVSAHDEGQTFSTANIEQSDIPRLRTTHVTNGYRDGIAESKAQFVQEGFDEGYSLGAVLGLKAGWCLGALDGICRALQKSVHATSGLREGQESNAPSTAASLEEAKLLFSSAQKELSIQSLFSRDYFGSDGIWTYDVPGQEDETETTFKEVSSAHPLLMKWTNRVKSFAMDLNLDLETPQQQRPDDDRSED